MLCRPLVGCSQLCCIGCASAVLCWPHVRCWRQCCIGRASAIHGSAVPAACWQCCIGCVSALRKGAVSAASAAAPCWAHIAAPCQSHAAQNRQCLGPLRVDCPIIGKYIHIEGPKVEQFNFDKAVDIYMGQNEEQA